ncbi:MAG: malto-oligosyltrehalose synthase, partial [Alphaproteobacteria bacterium]|nr:malto-oligosyltrehalose synthase [Alphaproteobacteria bacterium]
MIPRATYRIQFHKGFTFADGAAIAPYLARLGISHLYASPIQTARKGSLHGYDLIDHSTINADLGGADGFAAMATTLKEHGIGIILDIVPNHMCIASGNRWWDDLLRLGERSAFAGYFDIDWRPADPALQGKVLLPVLGERYEEALRSNALRVVLEAPGAPAIAYYDHRFPLRPDDAERIEASPAEIGRLNRGEALDALLARQHYQLAWWRSAGDRINWRRFFDINDLCALRSEKTEVFDAVHALPLDLYARGLVDGFRIDHIDGLTDPAGYCRALRAGMDALASRRGPRNGDEGYLVAEKILAFDESLPDWALHGTTGYDFLGDVSAFFHASQGEAPLKRLWQERSGRTADFEQEETAARQEIIASFRSQLRSTEAALVEAAASCDVSVAPADIGEALRALLVNLRVYRIYALGDGAFDRHFTSALEKSRHRAAPETAAALDFIAALVEGRSGGERDASANALRRFEQLSTTIAAKSVEDTAFYRHIVLLSRNDVGS